MSKFKEGVVEEFEKKLMAYIDLPCHEGIYWDWIGGGGEVGKCKHDYEIIEKIEWPSPYEQVGNNGTEMPSWVFNKKTVILFKCKLCKKTGEDVYEYNPGMQ